jgi:predicted transcriptional regulator of viral defense system
MTMKWVDFLNLVGGEPVFTSALLRSGRVSDAKLRPQLTRWKKMGRILQLRRGVYLLAPPYRKIEPHPFLIANFLRRGSYVSLQSALEYYGLIPEHVPVVTSVTTARPERLNTPMGTYTFHHVKTSLFFYYIQAEVSQKQVAFIATPEKALLDLIYLTPQGNRAPYLKELRLQNMEIIERKALTEAAERFGKGKIRHALKNILRIIDEEEYDGQ